MVSVSDPDGDSVHYLLYYAEGLTVDPETAQSVWLERSGFTGPPPFTHTVASLANGVTYAFLIRVYDEHGLEEDPPNVLVLTATPQPYTPSPFPWPTFRKDEQNTGRLAGSSLREPLAIQWQREYRLTGTHNASCPVLDDDRVYIASQDGYVACFGQIDPDATGYSRGVTSQFSDSTIALYGDYLVVGGAGAYYILDREAGTGRGQYDLPSGLPVKSSPLVVDGVAYAGDLDGNVHAFDVTDGSEIWSVSLGSGAVNCAPVTDGAYIYLASRNGYLHKLDRETGEEVLRSPADYGTISTSSPVLYPPESPTLLLIGTDFVEGGENGAYAVRLSDLTTVAVYITDFGVEGSPLVVARGDVDMVLVGQGSYSSTPPVNTGKVAAYDLQTGALLWQTPDIGRIYLLIRPRRRSGGTVVSAAERLEREVLQSTAFGRLRKLWGVEYPARIRRKITAVDFDLTEDRLGIAPALYARLAQEVDIVISMAATVTFDEPIDLALKVNTLGPGRIVEFARACQDAILVHVSTAYVNGQMTGRIPEAVLLPDRSMAQIIGISMASSRFNHCCPW